MQGTVLGRGRFRTLKSCGTGFEDQPGPERSGAASASSLPAEVGMGPPGRWCVPGASVPAAAQDLQSLSCECLHALAVAWNIYMLCFWNTMHRV